VLEVGEELGDEDVERPPELFGVLRVVYVM
jgi:hypothetical protein